MIAQSKPYPAVQHLIATFADWLKHRRELNEMRQLDRSEFDRIAGDLRIAPHDLDELVRHGPHAVDELPKVMQQLGVDPERLGRMHPLLLRDLERVCALCRHKAQCDRDIAAGTAAKHYEGYCPNAATLASLEREPALG